ncbi:MAG: DNA repair protein RecO, partial [Desulfobacterales bacterium]|nr:DNA repair protein RecO [Desulfobacterales bacterium]
MSVFSTPAILLHRLDYGDFDLILTFLSLERGKITLIAKSAKKSTKRFAGILELFSLIEVVGSTGRGRGLPVLQEAKLHSPFSTIRDDINKTAYASYWCELINKWVEEN